MLTDITVKIKLIDKPSNAVKAVADVVIDFGEAGSIEASGFRLIRQDGKPPWVSPPSRQGKTTWFEVLRFRGPIKDLAEKAILKRYEQELKAHS